MAEVASPWRDHGFGPGAGRDARRPARCRTGLAGGLDAARGRDRQLVARVGTDGLRGCEPGGSHQAGRPRELAGHRPGDGRRVVPPGTGAPIGVEGMNRLLVCAPDHYQIAYEINPWMSVKRGADPTVARVQWTALMAMLEKNCGATLERIEPVAGLPDMVFTANAGIVAGRTLVLSQVRYQERRPEEKPSERRLEAP